MTEAMTPMARPPVALKIDRLALTNRVNRDTVCADTPIAGASGKLASP
jgi:hypothetical protein